MDTGLWFFVPSLISDFCLASIATWLWYRGKSDVSFWTHLLPNLLTFYILFLNLHFSSFLSYILTWVSAHFSIGWWQPSQIPHCSIMLSTLTPHHPLWPFSTPRFPSPSHLDGGPGWPCFLYPILSGSPCSLVGCLGDDSHCLSCQGVCSELLRSGRRGHHSKFGGYFPPNCKFRQNSEGVMAAMVICLEQCVTLGYLWVDSKSCHLSCAYSMAGTVLKILHRSLHIILTTTL